MQLIGITGSIASGKSTYLQQCKRKGAATIDADEIVHGLLLEDARIIKKIAALFPSTLTKEQTINRRELALRAFNDKKKLRQLEHILHPAVRTEIKRWARLQRKRGKKWAAVEVPLLFESNMQDLFDKVIVVRASLPEIKRRALKRPGMTEEKLRAILARQWPQAKKIAHSVIVIHTGSRNAVSMRAAKKGILSTD